MSGMDALHINICCIWELCGRDQITMELDAVGKGCLGNKEDKANM